MYVAGGAASASLEQAQRLGRKKTAAYQLVRLWPHTKTVAPQHADLACRAGPYLAPVASAEHALPAYGAQSLTPCLVFRYGARLVRQGGKTPVPKRAMSVGTSAHGFARRPLAFKAKLANGSQRAAFACSSRRRFCAARTQAFPAPQHFLCFLPLPQGQGSLRPTLASGLR